MGITAAVKWALKLRDVSQDVMKYHLRFLTKGLFRSIIVLMGSDEASNCCQVIRLLRICRPSK
jgi:hypothetical protein